MTTVTSATSAITASLPNSTVISASYYSGTGKITKEQLDPVIVSELSTLSSRLDAIEQRLAIIHVNTRLETEWQELKDLGDKYRQLEQEILEKEKIWEIIKK